MNGKVVVTFGPYAETGELVGGYILIEARDQGEDVALASKIPPVRLGGIEVRGLRTLVRSSKKPGA